MDSSHRSSLIAHRLIDASRVAIKAALIVATILFFTGLVVAVKFFRKNEVPWPLVKACYRTLLFILGIRVSVREHLAEVRPLLLVTNHSSYLDILAFGAFFPVRFTPKAEIGRWPLIGTICRLTGCVFIERNPRRTRDNRDVLHRALDEGGVVCLFPEGTTGNGKCVLPFRSSYFVLAEEEYGGRPLTIQPAAIRYTHISGMPIDSAQRHRIAWYGDMELLPHLMDLLKLGPIRAEIVFCPPVAGGEGADRKAIAARCWEEVAARY